MDVAPAGFKPFELRTPEIQISMEWTDWTVRDIGGDKHNKPACMARGKRSVKQFHRWMKDNAKKVQKMTFRDVVKSLMDAKIDFHQWCTMD